MLNSGTKLGPYEILSPVGAGGMGEVYRARDTRLDRPVAIKLLPQALALDAHVRERFQREARVVSSLDHPNVCALYDVGQAGGRDYLVMQFVEGATLAERLRAGALPIADALDVARQIAAGLEAAHERGIVHRDLKPANVKITPDGQVKILDFGIAKALGDTSPASDSGLSPTFTTPATQLGVILGTAAYMSPEQARGKPVDRRADIWAFGCVLYEMLTGRAAFGDETITDTLAAIVKNEPAWDRLPADTPAAIRRLLGRCLQKDPAKRLHDIADARIEIDDAGVDQPAHHAGRADASSRSMSVRLAWTAAAVTTLAALAIGAMALRRDSDPSRVYRMAILPPEGWRVEPGAIAVSPDGSRIAFVASNITGRSRLLMRSLDRDELREVAASATVHSLSWSPDSREVFFADAGELKKVEATGGIQTVVPAENPRGVALSADGTLVLATTTGGPLVRLRDGGMSPVTVLDAARRENAHRWPQFLPDGRRFLYFARSTVPQNHALYVGSIDSPEARRVMPSDSNAFFVAPDRLLFVRDRRLFVQKFDPGTREVSGDAVMIAGEVAPATQNIAASFSASPDVVAYTGGGPDGRELVWLDRAGGFSKATDAFGYFQSLNLSPDGQAAVVGRVDQEVGGQHVWLLDRRRTLSRLTVTPGRFEYGAVWSPDGKFVAYASNSLDDIGQSMRDIRRRRVDGSGDEEVVMLPMPNAPQPTDWSRDGRFIVFSRSTGNGDIWALPMTDDRPSIGSGRSQPLEMGKPIPILTSEFLEAAGQVSPDGRWLAYASNESGRIEVFVRAFPSGGGKRQISVDGGRLPRWRADGRELFFVSFDRRHLISVPIASTSTEPFRAGTPQRVVDFPAG